MMSTRQVDVYQEPSSWIWLRLSVLAMGVLISLAELLLAGVTASSLIGVSIGGAISSCFPLLIFAGLSILVAAWTFSVLSVSPILLLFSTYWDVSTARFLGDIFTVVVSTSCSSGVVVGIVLTACSSIGIVAVGTVSMVGSSDVVVAVGETIAAVRSRMGFNNSCAVSRIFCKSPPSSAIPGSSISTSTLFTTGTSVRNIMSI